MTPSRILACVSLAILLLIPAYAADISGTWTSEFDSQIGQQSYTYEFKVDQTPEEYVLRGKDLTLRGASGEEYARMYGDTILPKVIIKRQNGPVVAKESMRRVEYEDRLRDPDLVWYPKDLPLEKRRGSETVKYSARFTATSKLLGSIQTDFVDAK